MFFLIIQKNKYIIIVKFLVKLHLKNIASVLYLNIYNNEKI